MDIINRKSEVMKQTIATKGLGPKMQIAYNNWGHLSLRFFDANKSEPMPTKWKSRCKWCGYPIHTYNGLYPDWLHDETAKTYCLPDKPEESHVAEPNEVIPMTQPEDVLIILDSEETQSLRDFIKYKVQ